MSRTRFLAFTLLGASMLVACSGGTKTTDTPGVPDSSADGASEAMADTGSSDDSSGGDDTGWVLETGTPDTAGCTHLNIGIFGNAGANPSANFQQWLEKSGTSVQRIQTTAGTPVTAATLQPFDVVILDWLTRDYTPAEAATVAGWIQGGGGLVSMSGYDNVTTDDWHANSLISTLGVKYEGPLLNGPVTMFATHPITAGLTSVTFAGGYGIGDLGGTASTRTPIAFLPGNVNAGVAIQMGAGHAFVWGDEWIEFDSEWSTLPQIKQLWVQVFGWISPANKCALQPPT
jgi:hypothetical protein